MIYARFADFMKEIKILTKTKNISATQEERNQLMTFLDDCYSCKGQIVAFAREMYEGKDINHSNLSFAQEKRHPAKSTTASLEEVLLNISALEGTEVFLKTGTFSFDRMGEYSKKKLFTLQIMAVDIDDCSEIYNMPTDKEKQNYLKERYPVFRTLPPTYILESGCKGIHVIYVFRNEVRDRVGRYDYTNKLLGVLCGADMQRTGQYNSIRMPLSINQKTGRVVKILQTGPKYDYWKFIKRLYTCAEYSFMDYDGNVFGRRQICDKYEIPMYGNTYDEEGHASSKYLTKVEQLIEDEVLLSSVVDYVDSRYGSILHAPLDNSGRIPRANRAYTKTRDAAKKGRSKKNPKCLKGQKKRFKQLRIDLERYLDENNGFIQGHRNNFMYIMAICLRNLRYTPDSCMTELLYYNQKCDNGLFHKELQSIVKYVYNHNVRISNYDVRDMLDLSDNIMYASANWYTPEKKAEIVRSRNRKTAERRRKERQFAQRRSKKLRIVLNGIFAQKSYSWIAKKSGYSINYVYSLIKKYAFLRLALEIGKQTARNTLRSITAAKSKGRINGEKFILAHLNSKEIGFYKGLYDFWQFHIDLGVARSEEFVISPDVRTAIS